MIFQSSNFEFSSNCRLPERSNMTLEDAARVLDRLWVLLRLMLRLARDVDVLAGKGNSLEWSDVSFSSCPTNRTDCCGGKHTVGHRVGTWTSPVILPSGETRITFQEPQSAIQKFPASSRAWPSGPVPSSARKNTLLLEMLPVSLSKS